MTKDEALKLALEALENNRQTHHYCEDTWYSCPKHEDGCANDSEGDECNCGADKANAEIDKAITAIKESLAQPEQTPYITMPPLTPMWTIPLQRTWVGLTDEEIYKASTEAKMQEHYMGFHSGFIRFARAIEAKLRSKNESKN